MPKLAEPMPASLESVVGKVTVPQIERHFNDQFPGSWKPITIRQGATYDFVVNNPKAHIHFPSGQKFIYRNDDGTLELYSEEFHGPNRWAPPMGDDEKTDVQELNETAISLERDIEDYLLHQLDAIEKGLTLVDRQVSTDVGRIDILAEDQKGLRVIIEVKVGDAKDSAVGQIARYLGWYTKREGKPPRGISIAGGFPEGVRYAAATILNLKLITCRVPFSFEQVAV